MKMFKRDHAESVALKRARAGAAWLDTIRPGWDRRVNLTKLHLDNGSSCVLGQVYGDSSGSYYGGNGFDRATVLYGLSRGELMERGFVHSAYVSYEDLDEAWAVVLQERAEQRRQREHQSYAEGYTDGYAAGVVAEPVAVATAQSIVDRLHEEMSAEVADEVATF